MIDGYTDDSTASPICPEFPSCGKQGNLGDSIDTDHFEDAEDESIKVDDAIHATTFLKVNHSHSRSLDDTLNLGSPSNDARLNLEARLASLQFSLDASISEREHLASLLSDSQTIQLELVRDKENLSAEIEELTKVLFEEANGMVANEARARCQLEGKSRRMQDELESTREQLKANARQLAQLKALIRKREKEDRQNYHDYDFTKISEMDPFESLTLHYVEDLFPERAFDSKALAETSNDSTSRCTWTSLIHDVDAVHFNSFSRLLDRCSELTDSQLHTHPFIRTIFECDVEPCLRFDCKPRHFVKRVVLAMLNNCWNIERVPGHNLSGFGRMRLSQSQTSALADTLENGNLMGELGEGSLTSASATSSPRSFTERRSRLREIVSTLSFSVSSLPDMHMINPLDTPHDHERVNRKAGGNSPSSSAMHSSSIAQSAANNGAPVQGQPFCSLCARTNDLHYRFRLADREPWMLIDLPCRDRLVAAADLYTFLRHLRQGIYSRRPMIDLYFDLLHYRRQMFYARTGASAFYIYSDFEAFLKKLLKKSTAQEVEQPAEDSSPREFNASRSSESLSPESQ